MFKLKDAPVREKERNLKELKAKLENLKQYISEILALETGKNISTRPVAYDLVLITDFNSAEDLQNYLDHPEHQKILKFILDVTSNLAVVDYEM